VDARPVRLLIPPDASTDRLADDLGDQQIAGRIAAHEVVVARGDGLGRLDPILTFALRARGDDPREVCVVRRIAVHPERDAVEPRTRGHPVIVARDPWVAAVDRNASDRDHPRMRRWSFVTLLRGRARRLAGLEAATEGPAAFAVARVVDGDTLTLANGERVRLQIDAPEIGQGSAMPRPPELRSFS
jgi:hypothetical protein